MARRDGAATKKGRIQEIARKIHSLLEKHGEISLSKTIALLEYEYGLTKVKIVDYFETLETLEHFIIDVETDKIKSVTES